MIVFFKQCDIDIMNEVENENYVVVEANNQPLQEFYSDNQNSVCKEVLYTDFFICNYGE